MDVDRQGIKRSNDSIDLYDCALHCMLCLAVSFTVSEGYGEGIFMQTGLFCTGITGSKLRAYEG